VDVSKHDFDEPTVATCTNECKAEAVFEMKEGWEDSDVDKEEAERKKQEAKGRIEAKTGEQSRRKKRPRSELN